MRSSGSGVDRWSAGSANPLVPLFAALIAALVGILGATTVSAAAVSAAPSAEYVHVHAYDDNHQGGVLTLTRTERAPPSAYGCTNTHCDAVDRWSRGASVRPNAPRIRPTYTYDDPARFVQTARGSRHGVEGPGGSAAAGRYGVTRSDVAANAGDTLLSAGGGSARLPMNMGTVRGVASKYGIPIDDLSITINKARAGVRGHTASDGCITLCRGAFESEEQLAKTLVHERVHVEDLRAGMPYPSAYNAKSAAELRAEAIANAWWASFG